MVLLCMILDENNLNLNLKEHVLLQRNIVTVGPNYELTRQAKNVRAHTVRCIGGYKFYIVLNTL